MAPKLSSIYISGWQSSSTAASSNEPGPDFADYPMDTVPNKCDQLFRAMQHHERRLWEEECRESANPQVPDMMTPIVNRRMGKIEGLGRGVRTTLTEA